MLDRITIENFKWFEKVDVELGNPVVFIGPNNSGKTSALQALALWDIGLKRWLEKRKGAKTPEKRPGVTINRRDLIAALVPDAKLLWRNLHDASYARVTSLHRRSAYAALALSISAISRSTQGRCCSTNGIN